jgi:hypothetical protein
MSIDRPVMRPRDREIAVDVENLDLTTAGARWAPASFDVRLVPMPIAGPDRPERVRAAATFALGAIGLLAFAMAAAAIALG